MKLIPSLKGVRPKDLRVVAVLGRGDGLDWESLDLDLSVPGLVSSVFSCTAWLAELGRHGGRRTRLPRRSLPAGTGAKAVALGFDSTQRPSRADRQLLRLLRLSFESLSLPTQIGYTHTQYG